MKNNKKISNSITNNNIKQISSRSPIITIIGHIDHGKTTLLNYFRNVKKPIKEHGGITQYIKPYSIETKYGFITFLDTPGHAAFNSIRKKSVECSDIAILIIAIDDGIKPQTIESIEIAKKNNVPIIVAINKIDKKGYNDEKIINEISKYKLIPEKWGGDTLFASISAKTGKGINNLIDLINLQSEILELKAKYSGPAEGIVLDNKLDIGKGIITTVIILNGILKKGDLIQIKNTWGKIKTIHDISGKNITIGKASLPLYITGLNDIPEIGEKFNTIKNNKNINIQKSQKESTKKNINFYDLNYLKKKIKKDNTIKINIIIKTDVQGSINAFKTSINDLSNNKIQINITKIDIGNINKSDINLAIITKSILFGFNIKCENKLKKLAQDNSIKINIFNIIYELIDYIKNIIKEKTSDIINNDLIGIATVKKIFKHGNLNTIAGCIITYGKIKKNMNIKIYRKNILIYKGKILSIKILKNNTNEVSIGNECGISIKDYNNIQIDDQIKSFNTTND